MDKLGNKLESFISIYLPFNYGGVDNLVYHFIPAATPEQSLAFYRDIVDDQNFKYFPRQFQVYFLSTYAWQYITLNRLDEAIKIFEERVLPINENLNETLQPGWYILPIDKLPAPYFSLSLAYLKKGDKTLALVNYKEYVQLLRTSSSSKINGPSIIPLQIPELDKLIPSSK